jgi:hypothetical protein
VGIFSVEGIVGILLPPPSGESPLKYPIIRIITIKLTTKSAAPIKTLFCERAWLCSSSFTEHMSIEEEKISCCFINEYNVR